MIRSSLAPTSDHKCITNISIANRTLGQTHLYYFLATLPPLPQEKVATQCQVNFLCRDESACVTLQRVPKVGGKEGELEDYWLKYYHFRDGDYEFPVRNRQVKIAW